MPKTAFNIISSISSLHFFNGKISKSKGLFSKFEELSVDLLVWIELILFFWISMLGSSAGF